MCGQNSEIFTLCHRGSDVLKKSILLASEVADSFDKKALWAGMLHHSISLNLAVSFCIVIFCAESISRKEIGLRLWYSKIEIVCPKVLKLISRKIDTFSHCILLANNWN